VTILDPIVVQPTFPRNLVPMTLLGDLVKPQNGAGAWSTVKRVCQEQVTPDHVKPERPKLDMTGLGN
jgi:hypothetical protein